MSPKAAAPTLARPGTTSAQLHPDLDGAPVVDAPAGAPGESDAPRRRRSPGAHASRPRIVDDLHRVETAATTVAATLAERAGRDTLEVAGALNAVADTLARLQRPTELAALCRRVLTDVALDRVAGDLDHLEAEIARAAHTPPAPTSGWTHTRARSRALAAADTAGTVTEVTAMLAAYDSLTGLLGDVDAIVADATDDAFARTCATTLDTVIAGLRGRGLDAERLAAAAIHAEALRHDKLIWQQANKLARAYPDRSPDELRGWGWQGLVVALRRYDPDRCLFSTYACPRIAGAIRDGVRSEDPLPKRLTTYRRKLQAAENDLTQALGRGPTLAEVAAAVGASAEEHALIPRLRGAASIDDLERDTDSGTRTLPWLTSSGDIEHDAELALAAGAIETALAELCEEDALAIRLLVLEDRPLAEVRDATGLSTRQLRQRQRRGFAQLAEHLADYAHLAS